MFLVLVSILIISSCVKPDVFEPVVGKYTPTLTFFKLFGEPGAGDGQFYEPEDMAMDSHGNIYVSDWGNNRVQKFNSKGQFLMSFGTLGTGDGQFDDPTGIFIEEFGEFGTNDDQFQDPRGIGVSHDGQFIYVIDWATSEIKMFRQEIK